MKALENLVALRESGELAVVSITSDMSSILQEFIQQNNIKIDMMIDRNASIKRELGLPFVVPIDVFVARDGTVIDVVVSGSKATDGSVDSLTNSFLKILDSVAESQSVR
jgi:peroxiredoxin